MRGTTRRRRIHAPSLAIGFVFAASGCASSRPAPVSPDRRGLIVAVRGDVLLPPGVERAFVWEIDGQGVQYDQPHHPVDPGIHHVRV